MVPIIIAVLAQIIWKPLTVASFPYSFERAFSSVRRIIFILAAVARVDYVARASLTRKHQCTIFTCCHHRRCAWTRSPTCTQNYQPPDASTMRRMFRRNLIVALAFVVLDLLCVLHTNFWRYLHLCTSCSGVDTRVGCDLHTSSVIAPKSDVELRGGKKARNWESKEAGSSKAKKRRYTICHNKIANYIFHIWR